MSWLARWRRSAPIETPYNDASERFDAPPASALSISVLAAWPQMVQLRGIGCLERAGGRSDRSPFLAQAAPSVAGAPRHAYLSPFTSSAKLKPCAPRTR